MILGILCNIGYFIKLRYIQSFNTCPAERYGFDHLPRLVAQSHCFWDLAVEGAEGNCLELVGSVGLQILLVALRKMSILKRVVLCKENVNSSTTCRSGVADNLR